MLKGMQHSSLDTAVESTELEAAAVAERTPEAEHPTDAYSVDAAEAGQTNDLAAVAAAAAVTPGRTTSVPGRIPRSACYCQRFAQSTTGRTI